MSLIKLRRLRKRYPEEDETLVRLEDVLNSDSFQEGDEYTLDRIFELTDANSQTALALILGELVQRGVLKQNIHVMSPENFGGIGRFSSLKEIPPMIHDYRADRDIEVRPENLKIYYERL